MPRRHQQQLRTGSIFVLHPFTKETAVINGIPTPFSTLPLATVQQAFKSGDKTTAVKTLSIELPADGVSSADGQPLLRTIHLALVNNGADIQAPERGWGYVKVYSVVVG